MVESPSTLRDTLQAALRHSLAHIEALDQSPVGTTAPLEALRRRLGKPFGETGLSAEQVVSELARDVEGGVMGSTGGRFFAWVVGGALPAAIGADWLASAWDQNAALYATSPAAAVAEEIAGGWLKEVLGLPASASFALVTGCQMAHATCLLAARHALLARRGFDVEDRGLYGAPPIRILSGQHRHASFDRAVQYLGLGRSQVTYLPTDERDRLAPATLEGALGSDREPPTLVLLQAGDINIGSFDSFAELVPLAKRHGAWVHVDGAFGLWAGASPIYRHLVEGVAAADSWATDGHKWLNVPFDCGYAFVADPDAHRAAVSCRAAYITHDGEARDEMEWNPDWSRRARGFATYAALRQLGRRGVAELIERCCAHAQSLVAGVGRLPGAEVLWAPVINQGLVRFRDSRPGATEEDHDRRTEATIVAINATGEAFFQGTTWRGRRAMRVSVCNWRTSDEDVRRAVAAIARVL